MRVFKVLKTSFGIVTLGLIGTASLCHLKGTCEPQKPLERHIPLLAEIKNDEVKKLSERYCIAYGNKEAPLLFVEYFSLQCPHCIGLFKEDFERIKQELIDTGKIRILFHPVPLDLVTLQALICLEKLKETEKQLFLEVIFEEADPQDPNLVAHLMMKAMEVFKKPIPQLCDASFLEKHPVFQEISEFIEQDKIHAVPTVEVNGQLFAKEIPDYRFIKSFFGG